MNARQRRKRAADPIRSLLTGLRARGTKVSRMDRTDPDMRALNAWIITELWAGQGSRIVQDALAQGRRHAQKQQRRRAKQAALREFWAFVHRGCVVASPEIWALVEATSTPRLPVDTAEGEAE
jgi:hypothetical protein